MVVTLGMVRPIRPGGIRGPSPEEDCEAWRSNISVFIPFYIIFKFKYCLYVCMHEVVRVVFRRFCLGKAGWKYSLVLLIHEVKQQRREDPMVHTHLLMDGSPSMRGRLLMGSVLAE